IPFENLHLAPELPVTVAELVNDKREDKEVKGYLARKAEEFEGLQVATLGCAGRPAHCILDAARDADLVVMASHGTSGISRWLLGSVATKVVRGSETPVLVVNAKDP